LKLKRKLAIILLSIVFLFVLLEIFFQNLQSPNTIKLDGNVPFLMKTSWHQIGEYAKYIEYDTDAGCWAVAIAQIAHYHRINPSGEINYITSTGKNISVNLDDYNFTHELLVPRLNDNVNSIEREQVAKYIYYIAALIFTDFGSSGYLDHETMVPRLERHLNCEVDFYEYKKQEYLSEQSTIRDLIKYEIDNKRPIMIYFDNGDDFGHAAVIDGYFEKDSRFLIHLNMGWGGEDNGWYDAFEKFMGIRDDMQNRFFITFSSKINSN